MMAKVNHSQRKVRWSEAATLEFVKMYLKYECLWSPEHPSYRKKESRDEAFTHIMDEFKESTGMSVSPLQIKKKIKNLRTTYSQQLHKIISRSTDPDCLFESSLPWFELMDSKLSHVSNKHMNRSAVKAQHMNLKHQEDDSNKMWTNESDTEFDKPLSSTTQRSYSGDVPVKSESAVTLPRQGRRVQRVKKKKKLKLKKPLSAYSSSDVEQERQSSIEDEFDIYGKHIAAQLRRMDLKKALRLQVDINNLISGARISQMDTAPTPPLHLPADLG